MPYHLLNLELRLLARERAAWVLLALFAAALGYGLWNGGRVAGRHREAAAAIAQDTEAFQAQVRQHLGQQAIDPKAIAGRGTLAVLPPAPLPLLATGQSDLSPGHESVVLWRLTAPGDTRSELENPSHLLAGRFDLAFVLVWLYPLFLLALVYDLMAGDRESGTLRLALSRGITPWRWLTCRALARSLPMLALAALGTLAAGISGGPGAMGSRLMLALAVVLAYGLFWVALASAVNAVARSAASAATSLGAAWVLLVLVAPTLLNVAVESLHPTPSRPELVAAGRKASGAAEKRGGELLNSFYRDHPELAPPGQQADFAAQHLTVQSEVGRAVEPVRQKFDEQLARQQAAVGRWRFVSPAIAAHEALTDLAGTGYWRHRAFREQVSAFKTAVAEFYTPKIHRREAITLADYERMPRFVYQEDPSNAWMGRAGAGLAGMLALSIGLAVLALLALRPARLGSMTA
jgi:ABC-2 type transport system permease protein